MQIFNNAALAKYTSFGVGGNAEQLAFCESTDDINKLLLATNNKTNIYLLGFGTNVLISDEGLNGLVIMQRQGMMTCHNDVLIADAGMWWDQLVHQSIENSLWGLELLSGIPSSVGGAVVGNIAAYGQQVSDTLLGIEAIDTKSGQLQSIPASEIMFSYRKSSLQNSNLIVTKAAFKLSKESLHELTYESALKVATDMNITPDTLINRRRIIIETRNRAGSLYDPNDKTAEHTAGSFFKNPVVETDLAKKVASYDETGKSLERILAQNKTHGGVETRVSAAHVLLAAGYKRGQNWGNVRLHPEHVLKIENTGNATAQEIYDVAKDIMKTVKQKLGITLEPEVKFLGNFSS